MTHRETINNLASLQAVLPPAFSLEGALYIATLTDALQCGDWQALAGGAEELAWNKLLQLRIFTEAGEFLADRDTVRGGFALRTILDEGPEYRTLEGEQFSSRLEETNLLDIDTSQGVASVGGKTQFHTMGGGVYRLPVPLSTTKVVTYTYFQSNPENGIEFPVDWRVVRFE